MSLFSFLRKNKQDSDTEDSTFYSRAEEDSKAVRSRRRTRGKGEEATDPVLPEKKRARRRLIGAVALVLAAVVGLPMILDSEPKPLGDDIEIRIPSRDKTPPPSAAAASADQKAALDEREEVVEPAGKGPAAASPSTLPSAPDKASKTPTPADKPETSKPPVAAKPEPRPEPKTETKPEAKASPRTDARPPEPQDDARARALLEGKTDPKADKKDSGKYVVQVAALASKEKVNELQSKLKSAGIKSYTQTVSTASGERTRIRVGPFASKDEAEKVRARIVNLGLNGTLVPA